MVSEENDDFKLVKYSSRKHRKKNQLKLNNKRDFSESDSVEEITKRVNVAVQKFNDSPFRQTLLIELKKALETLELESIVEIVCYGLGNFSEFNCAKYQLAALLAIKAVYSSKVHVYDPLFFENEIECLKSLKLHVIEKNEEGKRLLQNHSTLVFMPHCSKQLTNNFLHTNWSPLIHNCILLGNSWSELECHTTDALLQKTALLIYKLKKYTTEIKLKNNFEYPNTFSGTSIHIFTKKKLEIVPCNFWENKPRLISVDNDPEFITKTE